MLYLHAYNPHRYFGGSLDFLSLDGWGKYFTTQLLIRPNARLIGSDVFIKLRCLDSAGDVII